MAPAPAFSQRQNGTPSFVKAEFWDRDASLAAAKSGGPVPAPLLVTEP
jgi:hypothetical protein